MSDTQKELFSSLVMMLGQSALLHMGKLVNPATGKAEAHLDYAQDAIDTLDMLEAKTRGNLDADEARLLKTTLSSLKLTYVETLQKPPAAEAKPVADTPPPAAAPATEPPPTGTGEGGDSKVRYHKTFD